MAEHRVRERVPLQGVGVGLIHSSGKRFAFRVENYSLGGMLLHMVRGTVPGIGEDVGLTIRAERLGESPSRFSVSARVMRHEKRKGRILCGVQILGAKGEGADDAMDHAYLEGYFEQLI
jgi:hypothetical protein